ncbi:MAG: hypothetical protein K2N15_08950 [Lachnospiraceae bacterium]|nr:hypothetical protein [Lachnospiraceae bacterium]
MADTITPEEFKVLSIFMEHPDQPIYEQTFDTLYPRNSLERISAVGLCDDGFLKMHKADNEHSNNYFTIERSGRIAYKRYLDSKRFSTWRYILSNIIIPLIIGVASAVIAAMIIS